MSKLNNMKHLNKFKKNKNKSLAVIQQLFEQQVTKSPDSIAVVYENQELTYSELNKRANQLAHYLRGKGIGPETLVGICVERSLEMIVGLLGILKAGGAYLPLDPAYPKERLKYIVNDSGVKTVLTKSNTDYWVPEDVQNISLEEEWIHISQVCNRNPLVEVIPDNLAYVIYTSGSTGNPKGVLLEQKGLCNLVHTSMELMQFTSKSRVIQFASLSFDASVFNIFTSLVSGSKLYVCSEEDTIPVEPLTTFLQKNQITHALLPPTVLNMLDESQLKDLQVVISGGSACSEQVAHRWSKNRKFINAYGPTEATVYATAGIYEGNGVPHIGRPIPNVEVYVLDQNLQSVAVGVAGELCIGGIGVARGYLNRPELTERSFIAHPFNDDPYAKLYRTGDLVKYLPDGNIEYIDRIDNQVKIRGFRIELGEIESVLNQYPKIKEVAVMAREDEIGDKRLVAYISGEGNITEWREHVKEKLPNYMVPSYFVKLDALPLTINGKVDTKALPKWEHLIKNTKQYIPPCNEIEKQLVEIWSDVLRIDSAVIGVQDSFFELGGHSLLATKIIVRLQESFNIKLPLGTIFKYSDIKSLSKKIETLSQLKYEDVLSPFRATARNEYEQLSYAQQRLWFIDKMETNSSLYNIPLAWRLKGQYNIKSLTKAFNQLMRRHEILRTVFKEIDGKPMQFIQEHRKHSLPVVDLRHLSYEEKSKQVEILSKTDVDQPFNLRQGPLIRASLLLMENDELVIHCTIHHIIFDGWSLNIFIDEWMKLYQSYLRNQTVELPPLSIQYTDFANWQRNTLQGDRLEKQLGYWKKELDGPIPVLQLPLDFPRPTIQTYNGRTHQIMLPNAVLNKLKTFSRKESVTLFTVLLASYQGFLSRYTGQKDILVGSPIANRHYPEIEGLIGFFVNTLVYRTNCTNTTTFKELVKQVNGKIIEAQDHQDVPFEKIVEAVKPERNASYSPLFQTMFVLQNQSQRLPDVVGHQIEKVNRSTNSSKFDLTVITEESDKGLKIEFEYNTDLFHPSTMERMIQNFEIWLNEVVDFPEKHIVNLKLISKTEEQQLLKEWTNTKVEYPKECVIQELFEQQVVKSPDAIAVVYKDQQLTYRELNERANQLAHYLQKKGVCPETLVGICVEKSLDMIVGVLGILKAGGAYIPLDPAYPEQRLNYILNDANIKIMITQTNTKRWVPEDVYSICINEEIEYLSKQCIDNPGIEVNPNNLAYVIYTSGSTGNPKGVLLEQNGLCNLVNTNIDLTKLDSSSRVIQFASFSFDVSVSDIFGTLISGGSLYICSQNETMPVEPLTTYMQKHKITHAILPPAVLNLLEESQFKHLHYIMTGGSACSAQVAQRWSKNRTFINAYGPTEATVYVTAGIYEGNGIPPIGRSIPNVEVYVLDPNLQPVPVGVAGELYIGGIALARGYLNRPELTATAFISHPFNDDPDAKIYKTGDLVKYLPDGNIEYIERIDNQVKIRGFRIELGEIEAVLEQHPGIREVVVVAQEDKLGDKQLIAYVVGTGNVQEWKNHIQSHLPSYMIPAHFVNIESIPLTINGKVDTKSLPEWQHLIQNSKEYTPPRNTIEERLVAIWSEVLGISSSLIGVEDSFFELGGHSLKIMATLVKTFSEGWDISIKDYYELKTISKIAEKINSEPENSIALNESNIQFLKPPKKKMAKNKKSFDSKTGILLTGSTGYLGIHLLEKLLDTTQNRIYCVVRGEDNQQANVRLTKMLKFYFKDKFEKYEALIGKRLFIIKGELADEQFGLDDVNYEELKEQVDIVIHAAALTKHFGDWADFENANVQSVKELLTFVGTNKQLHHISTTSVSGQYTSDEVNTFTETDFYIKQNYEDNVYVKSKFLAEQEIFKAIAEGTDANIYRVGNLTNRYCDGQHQFNLEDNAFMNRFKFMLEYGVATKDLFSDKVEFTPVDYCSGIIMKFVTADRIYKYDNDCVYHIYNHKNIDLESMLGLLDSLGYSIKLLSSDEYQELVLNLSKDINKQKDIQNLMALGNSNKGQNKQVTLDSMKTQKKLKMVAIDWPTINEEYLEKVIHYMIASNFVNLNPVTNV